MGGQVGPRKGAQKLALSDRRPRRTSRVQGGEGKLEGPPRPGGTPGPPDPRGRSWSSVRKGNSGEGPAGVTGARVPWV